MRYLDVGVSLTWMTVSHFGLSVSQEALVQPASSSLEMTDWILLPPLTNRSCHFKALLKAASRTRWLISWRIWLMFRENQLSTLLLTSFIPNPLGTGTATPGAAQAHQWQVLRASSKPTPELRGKKRYTPVMRDWVTAGKAESTFKIIQCIPPYQQANEERP